MMYEFVDELNGDLVVIEMSMHDAIDIGKVITHEGRKVRRIISLSAQIAVQRDINFSAVSQAPIFDRGDQQRSGHPHWNNDPEHYGYGCPVMTSRKDIKDYLKENGGVYDADGGMNGVKA